MSALQQIGSSSSEPDINRAHRTRMANQPTPETEAAPDISKYMIHSRIEILYILRAVQNKNELITAYFNQGNDFILTSIIEVDSDTNSLILDFGSDDALNHQAATSDRVILSTTQDRVKVQFVADSMEIVAYQGRPAFKIAIPGQLLKLQRREYYRLSTPIATPIQCSLTKTGGGTVTVTIADISLGGFAIVNYQGVIALEVGEKFTACRFVLPEIGTVNIGIEVRNEYKVTMKNGARNKRAGCMFIDPPPSQQAMIQRYITKLDRERRARLTQ